MGIFRKQAQRKPLTTVLLILLLALSIAASSIGFTAWVGAQNQIRAMNAQYTTIAIPKEQDTDQLEHGAHFHEDGSIEWGDGQWYYPPDLVESSSGTLPQVSTIDRRCLLGAQVKGVPSLTSGKLDILQYNYSMDQYSYNLSVLAVKCVSCVEEYMPGEKTEDHMSYGYKHYFAEFEIVDVVCQNDVYVPRIGKTFAYGGCPLNQDGTVPFEVGSTYLMRGFYQDYPIVEFTDDEKSKEAGAWQFYYKQVDPEKDEMNWYGLQFNAFTPLSSETFNVIPGTDEEDGLLQFRCDHLFDENDLTRYRVGPEDALPYFAEYTGDWQDFLNTPDGAVWRDEIIPLCEMNYESATVMLTDNLQSLYAFNVGDASILEGESFSRDQFRDGAPVCLVSAAYAKANGLALGDVLTLDFYNSGYGTEEGVAIHGVFNPTFGTTICRHPLSPESRIGFEQEYTIIGIYTAPEFSFGTHSFHADTIFVPKASVPNAAKYEDPTTPILNTLILENGTAEEFEAAISDLGYGKYYLYFDQNYAEAAEAIASLDANALRMMITGVVLFTLASLVFLLLFARRIEAAARAMRLLGISRWHVWRELTGSLIGLMLIALILGTVLGMAVFDRVTAGLLSEHLVLSVQEVVLCAGVQFCVLVLIGSLWMLRIASRNLMQSMKKGRWQWKKNEAAGPSAA